MACRLYTLICSLFLLIAPAQVKATNVSAFPACPESGLEAYTLTYPLHLPTTYHGFQLLLAVTTSQGGSVEVEVTHTLEEATGRHVLLQQAWSTVDGYLGRSLWDFTLSQLAINVSALLTVSLTSPSPVSAHLHLTYSNQQLGAVLGTNSAPLARVQDMGTRHVVVLHVADIENAVSCYFIVTATQNQTKAHIHMPATTSSFQVTTFQEYNIFRFAGGSIVQALLHSGQSLTVSTDSDLDGAWVHSDRPVAVTGGLNTQTSLDCCLPIPWVHFPPVNRWGKEFVTWGDTNDVFKVVSFEDNTTVTVDGEVTPLNGAPDYRRFDFTSSSAHYFLSDKPVIIHKINAGRPSGILPTVTRGPLLAFLSNTSGMATTLTFQAPQLGNAKNAFLVLVVENTLRDDYLLDGFMLDTCAWHEIASYAVCEVRNLSLTTHRLTSQSTDARLSADLIIHLNEDVTLYLPLQTQTIVETAACVSSTSSIATSSTTSSTATTSALTETNESILATSINSDTTTSTPTTGSHATGANFNTTSYSDILAVPPGWCPNETVWLPSEYLVTFPEIVPANTSLLDLSNASSQASSYKWNELSISTTRPYPVSVSITCLLLNTNSGGSAISPIRIGRSLSVSRSSPLMVTLNDSLFTSDPAVPLTTLVTSADEIEVYAFSVHKGQAGVSNYTSLNAAAVGQVGRHGGQRFIINLLSSLLSPPHTDIQGTFFLVTACLSRVNQTVTITYPLRLALTIEAFGGQFIAVPEGEVHGENVKTKTYWMSELGQVIRARATGDVTGVSVQTTQPAGLLVTTGYLRADPDQPDVCCWSHPWTLLTSPSGVRTSYVLVPILPTTASRHLYLINTAVSEGRNTTVYFNTTQLQLPANSSIGRWVPDSSADSGQQQVVSDGDVAVLRLWPGQAVNETVGSLAALSSPCLLVLQDSSTWLTALSALLPDCTRWGDVTSSTQCHYYVTVLASLNDVTLNGQPLSSLEWTLVNDFWWLNPVWSLVLNLSSGTYVLTSQSRTSLLAAYVTGASTSAEVCYSLSGPSVGFWWDSWLFYSCPETTTSTTVASPSTSQTVSSTAQIPLTTQTTTKAHILPITNHATSYNAQTSATTQSTFDTAETYSVTTTFSTSSMTSTVVTTGTLTAKTTQTVSTTSASTSVRQASFTEQKSSTRAETTSSSVGKTSPSVGKASPSAGTTSPSVGTTSPSVGTTSGSGAGTTDKINDTTMSVSPDQTSGDNQGTVTAPSTSPTPQARQRVQVCYCAQNPNLQALSLQQLHEKKRLQEKVKLAAAAALKRALTVPPKNTSATRGKYVSKDDKRPSSSTLGVLFAVLALTFVFGMPLLIDGSRLLLWLGPRVVKVWSARMGVAVSPDSPQWQDSADQQQGLTHDDSGDNGDDNYEHDDNESDAESDANDDAYDDDDHLTDRAEIKDHIEGDSNSRPNLYNDKERHCVTMV